MMAGARLPDDHTWPPDDASLMETTASGDPDLVTRSPVAVVPTPGDYLGPYVVEGTLGAGAMGVVYRAVDPDRGDQVAVKLLHRWHTNREGGEDDVLRDERHRGFGAAVLRQLRARGTGPRRVRPRGPAAWWRHGCRADRTCDHADMPGEGVGPKNWPWQGPLARLTRPGISRIVRGDMPLQEAGGRCRA